MERYQSNSNPNLRLVATLLKAGAAVDSTVSAVLKEEGLTHIQFNILRILQGASPDPVSAGQVNERLMFTKSDVTRLLDRLEAKALICRNACPSNRRKLEITITTEGAELVNVLLPRIEKATHGFYADIFTADERDLMIDALSRITEKCPNA